MEATGEGGRLDSQLAVSIHASVMEATCAGPTCAGSVACFDPRLRDGGDVKPR